jgi:hypothetical protein
MAILTEKEEDELLRLLDRAIYSDNPTVKKALKNLMLVTALCEEEHTGTAGLFSSLRKEQMLIRQTADRVEKELTIVKQAMYGYHQSISLISQRVPRNAT